MINDTTSPQIQPPVVPDDFQFADTPSETMRQILLLLSQSKIIGINQPETSSFDIAQTQQQLASLNELVTQKVKPRRFLRVDTVPNGIVTVPFDDVGTNDYSVTVNYIGPNGTLTGFEWAVVDGSKNTNQVQVRTTGRNAAYDIEVVIQVN